MDFDTFKEKFTDILGEDAGKALEALEAFKKAVREKDGATEARLVTTMKNLITRQGKNKSKVRCLYVRLYHQFLNKLIEEKSLEFWTALWSSQLWEVLVQIAEFGKEDQDPSIGKHIFMDEDIEEQNTALVFYEKLREFIKKWSDLYGIQPRNEKNQFYYANVKVFGEINFDHNKKNSEIQNLAKNSLQPPLIQNRLESQIRPHEASNQIKQENEDYIRQERPLLAGSLNESREPYQPISRMSNSELKEPIGVISGKESKISKDPELKEESYRENQIKRNVNIQEVEGLKQQYNSGLSNRSYQERIDRIGSEVKDGRENLNRADMEENLSGVGGNKRLASFGERNRSQSQLSRPLEINFLQEDRKSVSQLGSRQELIAKALKVESEEFSRPISPDRSQLENRHHVSIQKPEIIPGNSLYLNSFDSVSLRKAEMDSPRFSVQSNSIKAIPLEARSFKDNELNIERRTGPRLASPIKPLLTPKEEDNQPIHSSRDLANQPFITSPHKERRYPGLLSSIKSDHELEDRASNSFSLAHPENHESFNNVKLSRGANISRDEDLCRVISYVKMSESGLSRRLAKVKTFIPGRNIRFSIFQTPCRGIRRYQREMQASFRYSRAN